MSVSQKREAFAVFLYFKQDFRAESKSAFPLHGCVVMHVCYEVRIAVIPEPSGPDRLPDYQML
jgi:hypothetical protein